MEIAQLQKLLEIAVSAAQGAGEVICSHYNSAYEQWDKSPNNPVTTADLEADAYLRTRLTAATPEYGWLSEETADSPQRLANCCSWVVDPLDGTQEFIAGLDQFAVSVGFVVDGRPLLGVIHNPATRETFTGIVGGGVTYQDEVAQPLSLVNELHEARVLASDNEVRQGLWDRYQPLLTLEQVGSAAYKLGRVGVGLADAYISLQPKHEWDVCAGVAIVLAAGGQVTNLAGEPLRFNQGKVVVEGLIAANPLLHAKLLNLLRR
jgi:myo-inositol-1(or 4)-monophosphatase